VTIPRRLLPTGLALGLLLAGCGDAASDRPSAGTSAAAGPSAEADQAPLVVEAFEEYKAAALAADGSAAVRRLADTADAFYDSARNSALTATDAALRQEPVSTQLTVLFMRGSLDAALLRAGTPEELVVAAVDAGLVGEAGLTKLVIEDVVVEGDTANAAVLVDGKKAPFRMTFLRQEGRWTLDLLPVIRLGDEGFRMVAQQQGIAVDQLVDATLAQKYGKAKAAGLRKPLGR
jgi:hypothetical protein